MLVSQILAGFGKISTFSWFLDEITFILLVQMPPKKSGFFHTIEASVFVRVPSAREVPESETRRFFLYFACRDIAQLQTA